MKVKIENLNVQIHIHQNSPMADALVKAAMEIQQADENPAETAGREIEIPADVQEQIQDAAKRLHAALSCCIDADGQSEKEGR